jgi:hypothetical protein
MDDVAEGTEFDEQNTLQAGGVGDGRDHGIGVGPRGSDSIGGFGGHRPIISRGYTGGFLWWERAPFGRRLSAVRRRVGALPHEA